MEQQRRTVLIAVGLVGLSIAIMPVAPATSALPPRRGAAALARPSLLRPQAGAGAQFTPGLPLLDAKGNSTGAAEPSIRIDTRGHIYVTGPAGVPTGGCPFWRVHPDYQDANGLPYEYLGKFDTDHSAPGGGDCDIATGGITATGNFDNLAVSSLSLADLTVNQSSDGGTTFHTPANSAGNQTPGDDRQWNAADSGIGEVYLTVHDASTDNIQIATSIDGGYTYTSKQPAIQTTPGSCGIPTGCFSAATMDNHFGNIVVNPSTHTLYTVYVAPANAAEDVAAQQNGAPPNEHVVYVAVGVPSCGLLACAPGIPIASIAWTDHVVYTAPSGDDLAHIFPSIAIDAAGTVYVAWSDDPTRGANHIFMSYSKTPAVDASWSAPVQVDQDTTSHSNMLPWIVAGAPGALDVVWYSAHLDSSVCPAGEPTDDSKGVNNNCHDVWTTQFAQSLNADSGAPTFTQSAASDVIHKGSLCDQGLNCNLFGGDRTLLDFFQVDLDPAGAANIAYASDVASPGNATITYTRQCSGPSARSGATISYPCGSLTPPPPPPPPDSCSGQNVVTDPAGDATNPLGLSGSNDQVDITGISFSTDPAHTVLTTTMQLVNLSDPPTPITGTADTYYYVVWTYPGNGTTYATLAAEPDPSGHFAFSYGPFDETNNQIMTPTATTGTVISGTGGTISVQVPLSAVGSPTIPVDTATNPNAAPAVARPYGLTISGEGALGTGLVYTHPDDRAPNQGYGARWAVCPSGAVPSATATGTAVSSGPGGAGSGLSFGPATIVDDQREGGEPDVKVCGPDGTWSYGNCGLDNPYSSAPYGFSTTSSFVWRSEDQGRTFKLVPSNNTTGKPDACPGGGDTDLGVAPGATQASDFLSFIDLQGLTNFSSGVSSNGGQTFTCNPASSLATIVDRQWFGFYKNPSGSPNGSITYLDYDLVAGATCLTSPNAAGNAFVVQKSTDGGLTYGPTVIADCNDGIAGNMQVNQTNGHVFAIHTAYATPMTPTTTDAVVVNRSTDNGTTWTRSVVFSPTVAATGSCTPDCTVGQDFAVLAIDKAGGLYAVWSQANVDGSGNIIGPSHIYYSYSPDEGGHWLPEQQVDAGSSTNVDLFPWIAAGNPGAIDVVWYGTTKDASISSYDPGKQVTDWFPYMAQSLNATRVGATFSTPIAVSQHPNHNGGICTMGLGCTTGGDRSLADFFQVSVNKEGGADVVWADTSNNSNTSASGNQLALVNEARQLSGPTLFGTTLGGAASTCTAVAATPCQTDVTGDARYEANGIIGNNVPKLDITGSSLNVNPADPHSLDVRMSLANLSSLPGASDTDINANNQFVDYLTSWTYHVPGHTQADYDSTGNVYYAYLEVNRATGAVTAYDGNTCTIASTKGKYLVYPGQHAVAYHVDQAAGNIDLFVPLADVGSPGPGATLYSVTAHTVGQAGPAGPFDCAVRDPNGNNVDPGGQIFDVYDKSPAYTAVLGAAASPATPTATGTAATATGATATPTRTTTGSGGGGSGPTATSTPMATATGTPARTATSTPTATRRTGGGRKGTAPSAGKPRIAPRITLRPATARPGTTVTVYGAGFACREQVTLALNGAALATRPAAVTTQCNGTFSANFVAPSSLLNGSNTVSAIGTASRRAAIANLNGILPVAARFYFAGGLNTSTERSTLDLLNPNGQRATVQLTFYLGNGARYARSVTVTATSQRAVSVSDLRLPTGTFGLYVQANRQVAADLTVTRYGRDGDTLLGNTGLDTRWYLAEGYTGLTFHEGLAILNPSGTAPAHIRLSLLPFGGLKGRLVRVTVPAHTDMVVDVNRLLPRRSLSILATSDQPVVVERTLTFSKDRHGAGYGLTMRAGTNVAATSWIFAEGTTANRFQTFLTILNPNRSPAVVTARFYGQSGGQLGIKTLRVAGLSRANVKYNTFLRASGIASVVTSDRPIIVERPEYFGSPNDARIAGSDVFGRNGAGRRWSFASGDTSGHDEFLLLYNPSANAATVQVTVYGTNGRTAQRVVAVMPSVRDTLDVNTLFRGVTSIHGVVLRSLNGQGFVAEQTVFAPDHSTLRSTQGFAQ